MDRPSLAYRRYRDAIWHGTVPIKFTRLIPLIGKGRILELGAAEGVLSLLLAERGCHVIAVERNRFRHDEAIRLQKHWRKMGREVDRCTMVHADIVDRLDLFSEAHTFVAVRSIYYLREHIDTVFAEMSKYATRAVLCGNAGRARAPLIGINYYSSIKGMTDVLMRHGFVIEHIVSDHDPIVVGLR